MMGICSDVVIGFVDCMVFIFQGLDEIIFIELECVGDVVFVVVFVSIFQDLFDILIDVGFCVREVDQVGEIYE